jgi:hypothetical protein
MFSRLLRILMFMFFFPFCACLFAILWLWPEPSLLSFLSHTRRAEEKSNEFEAIKRNMLGKRIIPRPGPRRSVEGVGNALHRSPLGKVHFSETSKASERPGRGGETITETSQIMLRRSFLF